MLLLLSVSIIGWVAASVLGAQAYFRGEQTKAIHQRNINSQSFAQVAAIVTGRSTDFSKQKMARQVKA